MSATPTRPAEFEEALADRARIDAMFANGTFGDFVKGYANTMHEQTVDAIRAEAQIAVADMLKDNKGAKALNLDPVESGPVKRYSPIENKRAVGAGLNGLYTDMAEMAASAWHAQRNPDLIAK